MSLYTGRQIPLLWLEQGTGVGGEIGHLVTVWPNPPTFPFGMARSVGPSVEQRTPASIDLIQSALLD